MEAVPYVRDILGRYFRVSVFSFAQKLGFVLLYAAFGVVGTRG